MSQTRVLSIRFTEDEYRTLQSLSLITSKPVNAIVREAVLEKADRSVDDPEFQSMGEEAKRRLVEADRSLRDRVLAQSANN